MKITKKIALLLVAPFMLSSCATLFTKSTYPVTINSTPAGAEITVIDKKGKEVFVGESPAVVKLKSSAGFFSKAEYTVRIAYPGYQEYVTTIGADIEGWYFGNILFPWLLGFLVIDPATGAMWTLDTSNINAKLKSTETSSLQILDIKDISDDMKDKLVRVN